MNKMRKGEETKPVVVFQGGGQYFFWYMGVVDYLMEHIDATDGDDNDNMISIVGASAGALTAVFLACRISGERALDCALRLCDDMKVWDRWLKFIGIWGSMIEQWLDHLLPDNAADLCSGRVHILVSRWMGNKKVVSTFTTKEELIQCLRASTHIPFFMDYRPFRWFQGCWCYDGGIFNFNDEPYKVFGETGQHTYHIFYVMKDECHNYSLFYGLPFHNTITLFREYINYGYDYAKRRHETNRLSGLLPPL